jgi:putative oxidoreductase
MKQFPLNPNFGRLCLRIVCFLTLFLKHGTEKIFTFGAMAGRFPDPLHIGAVPSLTFAMIGDAICSLLIIIGLATRWAALISFINIFVAWALVHHFALLGKGNDHGELIVLYLGACLMLIFGGAGKYSVDALLDDTREEKRAASQASMARA